MEVIGNLRFRGVVMGGDDGITGGKSAETTSVSVAEGDGSDGALASIRVLLFWSGVVAIDVPDAGEIVGSLVAMGVSV